MRVGDFGFTIRIDTDFDLSGATTLTLNVARPDATTTTFAMTLGTVERNIGNVGKFLPNEYAEYIAQANDFDQAGTYTISLTANFDATQQLKTPDGTFEMDA